MRMRISLRLDQELSPFEARLLEKHLDSCTACSEVERWMGLATSALRAQPPVTLTSTLSAFKPSARRRRTFGDVHRVIATVAAAAVVLGTVTLFQASGTTKSPQPRFPSTQFTSDIDLWALKRADRLEAQVMRGRFVESDMAAPDAPSRRG
ncbi:MAG TPA: zf-HC2 domain-containing protein [Gaiellaceae bacterium]